MEIDKRGRKVDKHINLHYTKYLLAFHEYKIADILVDRGAARKGSKGVPTPFEIEICIEKILKPLPKLEMNDKKIPNPLKRSNFLILTTPLLVDIRVCIF